MEIIRCIYAYREKVTGRAVYVGSAFDVKRRDWKHCNDPAVPFDREIACLGRNAFTLEIVEAFRTETIKEGGYPLHSPSHNRVWL